MEPDNDEAFVEAGEDFYHAEPPPTRSAPPEPTMFDYLFYYLRNYLSNPRVLIILAYIFYKFIYRPILPWVRQTWAEWNQRRQEDRDVAEMARNPDLYRRKMEAMDEIRCLCYKSFF